MLHTILFWMALVSGGKTDLSLAMATDQVVAEEPPIFPGDVSKAKSAAIVIVTMWQESRFDNGAIGDHGNSRCAMQIWGGPKSLLTDPVACVRTGHRMLRESVRVDPRHPIAWYAGGGPGWRSNEARRISADRMNLTEWLLTKRLGGNS